MCARSLIAPEALKTKNAQYRRFCANDLANRRLASSPEAIYQSLRRRRERLESRLRELEILHRGGEVPPLLLPQRQISTRRMSRIWKEAPANEVEAAEEEILDQATACAEHCRLWIEMKRLKAVGGSGTFDRRSGRGQEMARALRHFCRDLHASPR